MKKKIVIVTRRMVMGGVEKALLSMLNAFPQEHYEITVMVMGMGGELEHEIPAHVKLECLYGGENSTIEKICNNLKKGRFLKGFKIAWYTFKAKWTNNVFAQELCHSKMLEESGIEYDVAIAYHVPASFPVVYVMNNIKAKMKFAWVHSDVSWFANQLKPYKEYYKKYDKIFCVSNQAMDQFNNLFPELKEKTSVFYNLIDIKQLKEMAKKDNGFTDSFNGIRILTVGRLTKEKGQDILPKVLKKLIAGGFNIKWYCLGDGECRPNIESSILENGLNEHLMLLGTKSNPYPYISQCDIYVQPSRHEGYCISLAEARAFEKPIITTNTVGAREQIKNGENGIIVNFDENEIYEAIIKLINNQNMCALFEEELKKENINQPYEREKLVESVG